jgi:FkbM family methyltransferase
MKPGRMLRLLRAPTHAALNRFRDRPAPAGPLQAFPGYASGELHLIRSAHCHRPAGESGFITDRLGVRTRVTSLWDGAQALSGKVTGLPIPADWHCEAVEWVGLLKAVRAARGQFVAMELGAGWGPWLVAGAKAASDAGITRLRLLGVEADPVHFGYLRQHFTDNGLDPEAHTLLNAAVGPEAGQARWPCVADPRNDWGLRPLDASGADYRGHPTSGMRDVTILGFADLLAREALWDLVHIDVQGGETELCRSAMALLGERARHVVIGTHSRVIDGALMALFLASGWALENEKPARMQYRAGAPTPEAMTVADGVQVWRNPRHT